MNPRTLTLAALGTVLFALLLPVFSVQLERARRAKCQSNMREIATAMLVYASDYRGSLPVISPLIEGSRREGEKGFNHHAVLLLHGYVKSPRVFVCPSDKEDGDPLRPLSDDGSTGHARVSVGTSTNLTWFNVSYLYVAGLTLRDPGNFLVLADEHWDSEGDCPAECSHDMDAFDNHGRAGRNVVFLDGHGHWLPGPKIDQAYRPIRDANANYRTRTVD